MSKSPHHSPPPFLATAGEWPKMLRMMVCFFIKNDLISILPYYITMYYNLKKKINFTIWYTNLINFSKKKQGSTLRFFFWVKIMNLNSIDTQFFFKFTSPLKKQLPLILPYWIRFYKYYIKKHLIISHFPYYFDYKSKMSRFYTKKTVHQVLDFWLPVLIQ